jgi:5S rRNA maturation endonuclease (ribonuclease M5)
MTDFRAKRAHSIPGKTVRPVALAKISLIATNEKRRGVRLNSQVPIALEWDRGGERLRKEAQTRVVGPYGCLVVLQQILEVEQKIRVTNLVSKQTIPAIVVWRGHEGAEGWELGIELINPQMGFWGIEL